ncbi:MAG: PAAR domain-containing protein [Polyangiales bacterium]
MTGLPALKQFDLIAGIDVHLTVLPGPPPLVAPIPNPFVGIFFDPEDYSPDGASVRVQGFPRVCAGSAAKAVPPHLPLLGPFFKPPSNDGELFMGSSTVGADGNPLGYGGLMVLTCSDFGQPAPLRPGKSTRSSLYVPFCSFAIPIPHGAPVLVGGTPTITFGSVLRIAKTVQGRTTRWLWDADVPLHEWDPDDEPITWLFDPKRSPRPRACKAINTK